MHLSQPGLFVNLKFKKCPFRSQCPLSSPATHHIRFLFNFSTSLVLLVEGLCMSPFAYFNPVKESQYFLRSLFFQSLNSFLTTLTEVQQDGSGRMMDVQIPI